MRIEATVQIRRSPEDVWAFVVDHGNDERWCKKVESVEQAGERRWIVTHKPVPFRPPMILSLEHLAADPPRFLKLREEDDASVFVVTYRLEAAEQGTRFTQITEFDRKKLPSVLHRTFARGVRRDVQRQLRDLRRVLEAQ
ncbi:MAG TPA: SRPBCC family protein [Solirubrobacteraceae bacterium]|nr:SRPBCC family protein [Solirubrobacteraceae bacterium]